MREERATARPVGLNVCVRALLMGRRCMFVRWLPWLWPLCCCWRWNLPGNKRWRTTGGAPVQAAVVHDLQTLDNNAQLLEQLDSISGANDKNGD